MYITIIISLQLFLTEAKPTNRVVGGTNCTENEFPSFLQLATEGFLPFCGAVLLNSTIALTAAHCVVNERISQLKVIAGTNYLLDSAGQGTTSYVQQAFIHKRYKKVKYIADIAILKLKSPILENDFIKYAELPDRDVPLHTTCTGVGFGRTKWGDADSKPMILQKTPIKISSFIQNNPPKSSLMPKTFNFVGVGENSSNIANGDSGGPLYCVIDNKIVVSGIVSVVTVTTSVSTYMDVFKYKNWITKRQRNEVFDEIEEINCAEIDCEYPSFLRIYEGILPLCGAVLLNSNFALTAAHCVFGERINRFKVISGTNAIADFGGHRQTSFIQNVIFHPNFDNQTRFSDIAILKLNVSIMEDDDDLIKYAQLPDEEVPIGTKCAAVEYGIPKWMKINSFNQKTRPPSRFSSVLFSQRSANDYLIFGIGRKGSSVGVGDSGAPLYCTSCNNKTVLSGITFRGINQFASLPKYINVFKYKKWIQNAMK